MAFPFESVQARRSMHGAAPTYYEFFAGGGMARAGLGPRWRCAFANDFSPTKAAAYAENWGGEDLVVGDVWAVAPDRLPGRADLAWASSPCQDLSLAGARAGLSGARSSAFWGFWRLIEALALAGRPPRTVVVENVTGLLTSHAGEDFCRLCEAMAARGYRFGAVECDAALFLPQSRPRLFVIATLERPPAALTTASPTLPFHSRRVVEAFEHLSPALRANWLWWRAATPGRRNLDLAAMLEPDEGVTWRSQAQTEQLLTRLSPLHRARLDEAKVSGARQIATVFRRMRVEAGRRVQRAELRFDGVAGCLRTPAGGSSRQHLLVVEGERVRSRLLTGREGARLMGLPDSYRLPSTTTAALHLVGDGVAVPVVRHLAEQILEPLLARTRSMAAE